MNSILGPALPGLARILALAAGAVALGVTLASGVVAAAPGVDVRYENGFLRVQLQGSYAGSRYTVWRAGAAAGEYLSLGESGTLCTGDCLVEDPAVEPGATYYYRFDLVPPEGGFVSYGPFAVAVPDTPLGARVWPNPGQGELSIELSLPGGERDGAVMADARIVDLQGRLVRVVHHGPLGRGRTVVRWDGRGAGNEPRAGLYFLRFTSGLGSSVTRIVRTR